METDRTAYESALGEIRRLMSENEPDRERLVIALAAERRESSKIAQAEFQSDERIPLEDRRRFGTPLTIEEIKALQKAGLSLEPKLDTDSMRDAEREVAELMIESLTTNQAADRLRVTQETILNMARTRQLYSLHLEFGLERFPAFQFTAHGLLHGFVTVGPAIPTNISVLEVASWFNLKNLELFINDDTDQTLSPRDWLRAGLDPQSVTRELRHWDQ